MVVPRNQVHSFVAYIHELQKEEGIRIKSFGHAGDGNLHVYILKDDLSDAVWEKRLAEVMGKMYAKAAEFQGMVSGEHGIGYAKKGYLKASFSDEIMMLMRGIKKSFDPNNILNPKKVCQ